MTDQQTGQKIQIVTALEQTSPGKQQYILANADYSSGGKVILAKQESSSGKVILANPDGSGVNQLLFTSPDLGGQQIQVTSCLLSHPIVMIPPPHLPPHLPLTVFFLLFSLFSLRHGLGSFLGVFKMPFAILHLKGLGCN